MSNESLQNLVKSVDNHFEKTGVVLVGMHQELQEQKQRLGQYCETVTDLSKQLDEEKSRALTITIDENTQLSLVNKFEAIRNEFNELSVKLGNNIDEKLDRQVASIDEIRSEHKHLLQKIETCFKETIDETKTFFNHRISAFDGKITKYHDSHCVFFKKAFDGIEEKSNLILLNKVDEIRSEFDKIFPKLFQTIENKIDRQIISIAEIRHEHDRLLRISQGNFQRTIDEANTTFSRHLSDLEDKISTHHDTHRNFFKTAFNELDERRRALDAELAELRLQTKQFHEQQSYFIRKARNWGFILIFVAVLTISFIILLTKGFS